MVFQRLSRKRKLARTTCLPFLILGATLAPLGRQAMAQEPDLGVNASLHGKPVFPADNPWNQDISARPVDPNSANLIAGIGLNTGLHPDFGANYDGGPFGIPYVVVSGTQDRMPVSFEYADESDPGPYPIPADAPIEGGPGSTGDRHVLVIDRDNWMLYELYSAYPNDAYTAWTAGSGAIFDLNSDALRPAGWTSADAAGLPIFPGLVRYDEVYEQNAILHALRFTVQHTRRAYVFPARHFASSLTSPNLPPMGMRVRLKASYDISGFPAPVQVILRALKKYGMLVADNGSNWFISGAPDPRWNDDLMHSLTRVHGSAFEVVEMGDVITDTVGAPASVTATAGDHHVTLSWSASAGATGYNVKRAIVSGGPYVTVGNGVKTTGYADLNVVNNTHYFYVVSGVNATGQSVNSREASATPQAAQTLSALKSLALKSPTVPGGSITTGTVSLTEPAPTGGIRVSLASSSAFAQVPPSVVIAAKQTSATFSVTTHRVAMNVLATVSASYAGVTKTAPLGVIRTTTTAGNRR